MVHELVSNLYLHICTFSYSFAQSLTYSQGKYVLDTSQHKHLKHYYEIRNSQANPAYYKVVSRIAMNGGQVPVSVSFITIKTVSCKFYTNLHHFHVTTILKFEMLFETNTFSWLIALRFLDANIAQFVRLGPKFKYTTPILNHVYVNVIY